MPIYVYEVIQADGSGGDRFEILQSMADASLEHHPVSGQPVRRIYTPPQLSTKYTPGREKEMVDPRRTERAGFTRYERDKLTGRYHKTSGKDSRAPEVLRPNGQAPGHNDH